MSPIGKRYVLEQNYFTYSEQRWDSNMLHNFALNNRKSLAIRNQYRLCTWNVLENYLENNYYIWLGTLHYEYLSEQTALTIFLSLEFLKRTTKTRPKLDRIHLLVEYIVVGYILYDIWIMWNLLSGKQTLWALL